MNNYIGIDISINSTAIYIISNKGKKIISLNNKKPSNIYIKELTSHGVDFVHLDREKSKNYSKNEIMKLKEYDKVSNIILNKCINYIDETEHTYCQIEGYSFSKNTSSILDIVSFSTLIRLYLMKNIKNIDITIISPSSLKLEACKLSYEPKDVGVRKPKLIYINNDGVAGGSFKKPDMFKALLDSNISTPLDNMLKDYIHLTERKKIPNPIEDIIDSIFACVSKKKEIEDDTE